MLIPKGGKGGLVITCDAVKNMRQSFRMQSYI